MVGDNIRQVEFWTERYRIIGKVYTPVGAGHSWRFSDILNRVDRSFIPVCDVTVFSLETKDVVWRGDFLALNKVSIILATSED
jgi:hypothetical protein